jgi:hypothetical protein
VLDLQLPEGGALMARSYGRWFTSIWNDGDFRPLSVGAKLMYGFLISQEDLEHSGIIPLRPRRWARDVNMPLEDVLAAVKELDESRFTVTDEEAGELLVRSLIRRDDIWKQPNVFKAAASSAKASKSPAIKGTLYGEVRRLELSRVGRETQALRDELLTLLEPFANHSPNPPEGFPRGSGDHSPGDDVTHSGGSSETSREDAGEADSDASVDNPARSGDDAGQNPSGTVSEGLANHSAGATGKGDGYGPVVRDAVPRSPTPSPVAGREPVRPLWPTAIPDAEDSLQDDPPDIGTLVAEVRALRSDWATKSIRRALNDPSVRERPWPVVRRAMLAVATDPASKQPGRLLSDGDWWHQGSAERVGPSLLPWCGQCDEKSRMLGWDGDEPEPCPRCKTNARAS